MTVLLEGVRVLDFGRYIAGPYCACLLGDLGAEVIRVERVRGGEDRNLAPVGEEGAGSLFLQMNAGKKGMTLNPVKPEGREVLARLIRTADIVVANFPPKALSGMGLDYASLKALKPDIILVAANAFGSGGPYSDRLGFDGVGQVMCGAAYMSGRPGSPAKAAVGWVDFGTAFLCAFATLAALMWRAKTGEGQEVEGALLKTAFTVSNAVLIEQAVKQVNRVGTGNRNQYAAPVDIFSTRDGSVIVQVVGQPVFERWAKLMGETGWVSDSRFKDDRSRGVHGEVLCERMASWCAERSTTEVLAAMEAEGVPAGPVLSPQEALDDPHIRALQYLAPMDYPALDRPAPVAGLPVTFSAMPASIRGRAPTPGEHTEEILAELGYRNDEIEDLRRERAV